MKRFLAALGAGLALAATALLAGPLASSAFAYPPADSIQTSSATVEPGGSVSITASEGTFEPGEDVTITVTGENGAGATFAAVRFAVTTATYSDARADSEGGLDAVEVTFPENASGPYTIAVFAASTPGGTVTVSIDSLSATGIDSASLLSYWVGGGALILAGATIAVAATVYRQRRYAD